MKNKRTATTRQFFYSLWVDDPSDLYFYEIQDIYDIRNGLKILRAWEN